MVDAEKASISYLKLCDSPSNTSHVHFTPLEMFSQPLFHSDTLRAKQGWVQGKGRRKETSQALLGEEDDRSDLLTLAF